MRNQTDQNDFRDLRRQGHRWNSCFRSPIVSCLGWWWRSRKMASFAKLPGPKSNFGVHRKQIQNKGFGYFERWVFFLVWWYNLTRFLFMNCVRMAKARVARSNSWVLRVKHQRLYFFKFVAGWPFQFNRIIVVKVVTNLSSSCALFWRQPPISIWVHIPRFRFIAAFLWQEESDPISWYRERGFGPCRWKCGSWKEGRP